MPNVRIIVVDAQELVVDGLRYRFTETPDIVIVAHACDGKALFDLLRTHQADLVVIDVSVPGMDGIDATRKLRKEYPKVKVIAHSLLGDIEYVNSMLIEGASGYVLKNGPHDELPTAISKVMRGEHYLSDDVRRSIEQGYAYTDKRPDGEYIGLTPREREIIRLIAEISMGAGTKMRRRDEAISRTRSRKVLTFNRNHGERLRRRRSVPKLRKTWSYQSGRRGRTRFC